MSTILYPIVSSTADIKDIASLIFNMQFNITVRSYLLLGSLDLLGNLVEYQAVFVADVHEKCKESVTPALSFGHQTLRIGDLR